MPAISCGATAGAGRGSMLTARQRQRRLITRRIVNPVMCRRELPMDLCGRISAAEGQQVNPRNKIVKHDGDLDIQTNEIRNVSMLIAPTISCWEAGRWELTRARLQRSSDASLELTSSIRGHFGKAFPKCSEILTGLNSGALPQP